MNKVSIVIRNKNEASYLETTLRILTEIYSEDIQEIIIIDNESTDNSIEVAENYGCKIFNITDFTYGRAINMGIEKATSNYVLLLSSHAVPVGNSFFRNTISFVTANPGIAGVRYINSISNYKRAVENNFRVKEPLLYGLMAGCCLINKTAWEEIRFNEELSFSEDKEWSVRAIESGYEIADMNESFFYFINRSKSSLVNRYRNETLEEYRLHNKSFPSSLHIAGSFVNAAFFKNFLSFLDKISFEYQLLKAKLYIRKKLNNSSKT
ncbi:glycosyltransferase [Gramella jeungdoensis]|uniref:Glycosyltransferase n=1 Tax=Gramella jeungdoensis TaxID=708091 RepID=A0ABT0Z234_9FLAO|nr:glycosyltransferase [Gramella jeungdoensis]MCM8569217.1 glycosyltransferase [Gramella jeungdoensis]